MNVLNKLIGLTCQYDKDDAVTSSGDEINRKLKARGEIIEMWREDDSGNGWRALILDDVGGLVEIPATSITMVVRAY